MNMPFTVDEWHVHQARIGYSLKENRPFIFSTLLDVTNILYIN